MGTCGAVAQMTRTLQRAALERSAQDLSNNQRWMLTEIADDINAMTETGTMTASEAAEVLDRLAVALRERGEHETV